GAHVGVHRVLLRRGSAVTEVPEPCCGPAGRGIRETDGERRSPVPGVGRKRGGEVLVDGDVAVLRVRRAGSRVVTGQGDVIDSRTIITVIRVPVCRSLAVTEVPEPGRRVVR